MDIRLSEHAETEIRRRKLPEKLVMQVARQPQQTIPARNGLECRQSKFRDASNVKDYLLRVFVNPREQPNVVVTAYKTSKMDKYWRP